MELVRHAQIDQSELSIDVSASSSLLFLSFGSSGGIYLDAAHSKSVVGSKFDCSKEGSPAAEQWGHGVPQLTTLCMGLKVSETQLVCSQMLHFSLKHR